MLASCMNALGIQMRYECVVFRWGTPCICHDPTSFRNSVALVFVIHECCMRCQRCDRSISVELFDKGFDIRQGGAVLDACQAIPTDHSVELCLRLALDFWICCHHEEERRVDSNRLM